MMACNIHSVLFDSCVQVKTSGSFVRHGLRRLSPPSHRNVLRVGRTADPLARLGWLSARVSGDPPRTERQLTMLSDMSTHSSLASQPTIGPLTPPTVSALQEEDEEDEFALSDEEDGARQLGNSYDAELSMLPWHHVQLYRLYGKEADYFLHPKIEAEKKKVVKTLNPKLRKQGGGFVCLFLCCWCLSHHGELVVPSRFYT